MAIIKTIRKIYKSDGTFDQISEQTSADQVIFNNGDNLEDKYANALTAILSSQKTISSNSTFEKLNLSQYNLSGTKLSINNGGIKIGSNITKVLVAGTLQCIPTASAGNRMLAIYRNSSRKGLTRFNSTTGNQFTLSLPMLLLDVAVNDVIYLYCYGRTDDIIVQSSSVAICTYLTVYAL